MKLTPALSALVLLAASCAAPQPAPRSPAESRPGANDEQDQNEEECPCRSKQQASGEAVPAPPGEHSHPHAEAHQHSPTGSEPATEAASGCVVRHAELKAFENNGNTLVGIATRALGATSFEVWRTSVDVGSRTPSHTHESEEVFVVLRGRGRAHIGSEVIEFEAPATVIAPAGLEHYIENTGSEPTDSIVIVGIDSEIRNDKGEVMNLPWRN